MKQDHILQKYIHLGELQLKEALKSELGKLEGTIIWKIEERLVNKANIILTHYCLSLHLCNAVPKFWF